MLFISDTDVNHNSNDDDWIIAVATVFPIIFVTTLTLFGILATVYVRKPSLRMSLRIYQLSKKKS